MSIMKRDDNQGFTSIVVSLILVLVFSLITLSFATIARREQQNALNQQLATKAYYAAESGINKIVSKIKENPTTNLSGWTPDNCKTNIDKAGIINNGDTVVTCALVKTIVSTVDTTSTPSNQSKISFIETNDTENINNISFNWGRACSGGDIPCQEKNKNFVGSTNNIAPRDWRHPPVIQLSITPLNFYDRTYLINNTFNAYLYPGNSAGSIDSINADVTNNAKKLKVKCDVAKGDIPCAVQINVSGYAAKKFLIKYMPIYAYANTSSSIQDASGANMQITNSQVEIDVTAKSQDVLKRIKVRVPIRFNSEGEAAPGGNDTPDFVLQAANICKRMKVTPTNVSFINPSGAADVCNGLNDKPILWTAN